MGKDIKQLVKDFVNFDIEGNYYQIEDKDEMVRTFKKIVYEDDKIVRQFLHELFAKAKEVAGTFDLIAKEGEAEEVPTEEPEATEDTPETETPDETEDVPEEKPEEEKEDEEDKEPEEKTKNESVKHRYMRAAANYLYE
jgi:outer membrane biosynthesis protein TonB